MVRNLCARSVRADCARWGGGGRVRCLGVVTGPDEHGPPRRRKKIFSPHALPPPASRQPWRACVPINPHSVFPTPLATCACACCAGPSDQGHGKKCFLLAHITSHLPPSPSLPPSLPPSHCNNQPSHTPPPHTCPCPYRTDTTLCISLLYVACLLPFLSLLSPPPSLPPSLPYNKTGPRPGSCRGDPADDEEGSCPCFCWCCRSQRCFSHSAHDAYWGCLSGTTWRRRGRRRGGE
jgi:hypothetical protein